MALHNWLGGWSCEGSVCNIFATSGEKRKAKWEGYKEQHDHDGSSSWWCCVVCVTFLLLLVKKKLAGRASWIQRESVLTLYWVGRNVLCLFEVMSSTRHSSINTKLKGQKMSFTLTIILNRKAVLGTTKPLYYIQCFVLSVLAFTLSCILTTTKKSSLNLSWQQWKANG